MAQTVVGMFTELEEARKVVEALKEAGFAESEISLVAHRAHCAPTLGVVESVSEGTNLGKLAALGGVTGFAAGLVALAIPGIGPIVAAGPIAAELLGGGVGTLAGLLVGRMKEMGAPEQDAHCYCEAVRRGGILLTVQTTAERAKEAERILGEARVVDIDDCAAAWRAEGWERFDASVAPGAGETHAAALPFNPESLRPSVRREKQERRAIRSYFRVS
jgi:hypothetical protein